jgi:hypothetical protein
MLRFACVVLSLGLVFALTTKSFAEEKTLKGTITCAKCDLKKESKCMTVIVVKEDGKDVVYYFDDASGKKNHKEICQSPKEGSVTGTVSKDGDKMVVKVTKVEFK